MTDRKFRLNFIDMLIIIVLVVAVGVLGYIFVFSDDTIAEGEHHTVEYVVEITSINREYFENSVVEGDVVTLSEKRTKVLGTVTGVQVYDCYKAAYSDEEDAEVYTKAENLVDIVITFTSEAEKDEWGYCIAEDVYIPVNTSIDITIGDFRGSAFCIKHTVLD